MLPLSPTGGSKTQIDHFSSKVHFMSVPDNVTLDIKLIDAHQPNIMSHWTSNWPMPISSTLMVQHESAAARTCRQSRKCDDTRDVSADRDRLVTTKWTGSQMDNIVVLSAMRAAAPATVHHTAASIQHVQSWYQSVREQNKHINDTASCHKHPAVTATELLRSLDLTCRTLFQFSCAT